MGPIHMTNGPRTQRVVLSRDLSEFLIELSIALHRHSMYPSGHPSLNPAIGALMRRLGRLHEDRPVVALGVARWQLVIEGVTTDPSQPVLRRLAEGLHCHHLGAISISRGVEADEIRQALRALAADPQLDVEPAGSLQAQLPEWPHVKLHPLRFDGLALIGEAPLSGGESSGPDGSTGAGLWLGLARAAISADSAAEQESVPAEPSIVARAIEDHPRAEAYDQVIVGYLLQIAKELNASSSNEGEGLRRRISTLVSSLRPETLRRLVEMGGDATQRNRFVLDAAHGMAVDAVLDIVKAAAEANCQNISHGMVRMLSKLAAHAELGADRIRPQADAELREQVTSLLTGWSLDDPNPASYSRVLEHLATSTKPDAQWTGQDAATAQVDPQRVVQTSLEANAVGPLVDRAVATIAQSGQVGALLDMLESRPPGTDHAAEAVLATLVEPTTLSMLAAQEPLNVDCLEFLLPTISVEGYEVLLDALTTSDRRATRRRLLDLLTRTTLDVAAIVASRLEDEHWYVQRNMLVLLERLGRIPEGFTATPWTTHADARVRHAAIRLQLTMAEERDLAISTALVDSDPRVVCLGLTAVQNDCPRSALGRVASLAVAPESHEDVRLLAVGALGRVRDARALRVLLTLADGGKSLLGRLRLPPKSPVLATVIRALAEVWSTDPRAASILAAAAESSDSELRHAALMHSR